MGPQLREIYRSGLLHGVWKKSFFSKTSFRDFLLLNFDSVGVENVGPWETTDFM